MKKILMLALMSLGLSSMAWAAPRSIARPRAEAMPPPTGVCAGTAVHCVVVSWTAPTTRTDGTVITGALGYNVGRSATTGGPYITLAACSAIASTSCEDDTVVGGATYFYVVDVSETINSVIVGTSLNSPELSAKVPLSPPNAPTGLKVTTMALNRDDNRTILSAAWTDTNPGIHQTTFVLYGADGKVLRTKTKRGNREGEYELRWEGRAEPTSLVISDAAGDVLTTNLFNLKDDDDHRAKEDHE